MHDCLLQGASNLDLTNQKAKHCYSFLLKIFNNKLERIFFQIIEPKIITWTNSRTCNEPQKYVCSKCCTCKTASNPVSIQVPLVRYQCQHGHKLRYQCQQGHKLLSDQCQTNGHNFILYVSTRTVIKVESILTNGIWKSMLRLI